MVVDQELERMGSAADRRNRQVRSVLPRLLTTELVQGARHLGEADRALVKAVYERGLALKAVAAIHNTSAGRMHHRLRQLVKRLRSPLYRMVLRERELWPSDRRAIAEQVVLRGRSQREVARELGLTLHRVRTELEHLKALAGVHRLDQHV